MVIMNELTLERKAQLFDYFASRCLSFKLELNSGESQSYYPVLEGAESIANYLEDAMDMEQEFKEIQNV